MKLSVVATLYQSAPYVDLFYQRISAVVRQLAGDDYEIILVNDGSPDDSLEKSVSIAKYDPHLAVIDLSRNFGHHKAMMTGLTHSKGDLVFLIDSDLEEEPEWLLDFYPQLINRRADVIYGVQARRKGKIFERLSGMLYYRLFNTLSGIKLPENLVTARLMSRRYVNALTLHREREITISGLMQITGYAQYSYPVVKHSSSKSTYSFRKRISSLATSVTSFSEAPLVAIFYAGLIIFAFALLYVGYLLFNFLFISAPLSGWTSVMASIWLLGGMIISFIGVVGIYLAKVFTETKQRPYTIVRHIYGLRE